MAITSLEAINFSDRHIRPACDRLAQSYRAMRTLNENWEALSGTNAQKAIIMAEDIEAAADLTSLTYFFLHRAVRLSLGLSMASLFPNDAGEILFDNSDQSAADPTRPQISGADVRAAFNQWNHFIAWMEQNEYDQTSVAAVDYATLESFLIVTPEGANTPSLSQAVAVVDTRATEWITRFTVTDTTALAQLDAVGVNTGA